MHLRGNIHASSICTIYLIPPHPSLSPRGEGSDLLLVFQSSNFEFLTAIFHFSFLILNFRSFAHKISNVTQYYKNYDKNMDDRLWVHSSGGSVQISG